MEYEKQINNVVVKKSTFIGLLVLVISISSASSFFAGSYIEKIDFNENIHLNQNTKNLEFDDNPVVAEINDQKIRQNEVNDIIKAGFTQGQTLDGVSALDMIITKILLLDEAENRNITITLADTEEKLTKSYIENGLTKEQFEEKLAEFGTTYEQTLERFQEELIINEMLTDEFSDEDILVTDEEAKIFFEQNIDMIKAQTGNTTIFYDVSNQIKTNLLQQKQQQSVLQFVEDLERKAMIVIYQEKLQ
ncbi:MAG: hypothetical protein HKP26_07150 [Nitrosopumilus sp.]|nr:hypothetical protein [Nitrosopumilus sp.]